MAPLTHNRLPSLWIPTVIAINPAICSGKPVIDGTHIMVHNIHGMIAGGYTVEKILACYPELTREQVTTAIAHPAK